MADIAAAEPQRPAGGKENKATEQPYAPSWIDQFTDWIQRLPGPSWLFYLVVALALVIIRTVVGWSDGSYPVGNFFPIHILQGSSIIYMLCVLHYLDDSAMAALADFRPVLNVDTVGYERLRYQLTTMPARPVLAWAIIGIAFGVASPLLLMPEALLRQLKLFITSPAAAVVDYPIFALTWAINFVFGYHTFRQLRLVSRIYTQQAKVNIFETGALYAFSRVTALTTVALLLINYLYATLWSSPQNDGSPVIATIFTLIALVTFVWPLWGAHRLLQQEKTRWKGEVARHMQAVVLDLHRRLDTGDLQGIDALKNGLDSLVVERAELNKVSTWPWEPEAVRVVVTALLLPVVIWIITRVLERLGF